MRQTHLLTGLALMLCLLANTDAHGQLETLIMPGEVIEGHVEIETKCKSCHVAFERDKQSELCADCHDEVAADRESGIGFHGLDRQAKRWECSNCHTEHEGRDANIIPLDESAFQHKMTDFPLTGKHDGSECSSCHEPGSKHRDAPSDCFSCHESDNVHGETMGTECGDCHTPSGWTEVLFDHDTTDFQLLGKHQSTSCLDCHADQTFTKTPTTCYGCHAGDDAHAGRSGEQCENCHQPTGWQDTSFNHARDTSFELTGKHALLTCGDCHSEDPFSDSLDTTCISCHLEDDNHDGHFGEKCETCHAPDGFELVAFDHDIDTNHALHGAHMELECLACHIEPVFEIKPPASCGDCHEDDDPHSGTQGATCQDCHNEDTWPDNVFFDHDLTRFPLLGKHADSDCESCHESKVFHDAPTDCVSCHRDDNKHEDRFPEDCAACHSPVDWSQWRFDHSAQTTFELDGAHAYVECNTCHRQSLNVQMRLGSLCSNCHRTDDVHNGQFGSDCGRCHSTGSFEEVQQIR